MNQNVSSHSKFTHGLDDVKSVVMMEDVDLNPEMARDDKGPSIPVSVVCGRFYRAW